jgi:CRP-like cAMP-binding protein
VGEEELRQNAILATLPAREFKRLVQQVEIIDAKVRMPVHERGGLIKEVYFPLSSVFSIVAAADGQAVVEVATTGREGMVGLPIFLGAATSPHASYCQVGGPTARLSADAFRQLLSGNGVLHHALNRFTQTTIVQVAQNVVCNNAHSVTQRAARWLLTTHDRVGRKEFPLTQEFLAQMLGVRRPTVSEVASQLQSEGHVQYSRGIITVVNRKGLEKTTCQCYSIVKAEFDAMLRYT